MRKLLTPTAFAVLLSTATMYAGDQFYDFDLTGTGDPTQTPGFILLKDNIAGHVLWQLSNGAGNTDTSGYLQGTDANGSEYFGIFFPDVDLYTNSLGNVVSLPVKAFKFEVDLRIGNGTKRPADGFSISFCRNNDPALLQALLPTPAFGRWAGGDSVAVANDHTGASGGNPESGTRTGLALSFDTWEGNWLATNPNLPWTNTTANASNDREGINIRLDDVTLAQIGMVNRNGGCGILDGVETTAGCTATAQAATDSLQTGPWSGTAAAWNSGDGGVSDKTFNNLSWQHLIAELDTNKQITVTWKGRVILDHYQLQNFPTSQGRLVFAGRTGGSFEHTHFDNVHVVTTPAIQPVFQSTAGLTNGFQFTILNIGQAQVTNFSSVTFDGADVTSTTVRSNYLDVATYGTYTQSAALVPRTSHTVVTIYQAFGQSYTNTSTFVVPFFLDLPANQALALSDIDTSKPGFVIRPFQSYRVQPNALNFTEDLLAGFRGPNDADQSVAVGGTVAWTGVPRFSNGNGGALFNATQGPATKWNAVGIGTGSYPTPNYYDNSAMEMTGYLYFPNAGTYTMYIGSDDGYRLTFAGNPADRMGTPVAFFDGGRGLAEPGDPFLLAVPQAGAYPYRLIWENAGGGADFEWYTGIGTNYVLINDTSNPDAVLAYQAALPSAQLPAYLKRAHPGRDNGSATFFQPILVDLGNGTGSHTVNSASVALSVDGVAQTLTRSNPDSSTTRVVSQMGNNVWSVGLHTNVVTFTDNAAQNYSYTWTWTVANIPANYETNVVTLPISMSQPSGAVDSTKRGFRVHSYQSAWESPNHTAWSEMQLQGLHGPNLTIAPYIGTYWTYGDFNDSSEGYGVLDFHYSANDSGVDNVGNAMGEFRYNFDMKGPFGFGGSTLYRFGTYLSQALEVSALEIGAWLVFPTPGYYMLHVASDDGEKLQVPIGNLFAKMGIPLTLANAGRGIAGPSSGMPGQEYATVRITQAGAYPIRLLYQNGGTDGALELSVYKVMNDGSVSQVPVNQENNPESIMAYQGLSSGVDTWGPYVSYANPAFGAADVAFWQPIVVELTDGASPKTLNSSTLRLTVDGTQRNVTVTQPSAGVTRIVQQNPYWGQGSSNHVAVLTYADNSGAQFTNTWPFTVMNLMPSQNNAPGIVVDVPASSMVPVSSLSTAQPGFRVYPYQTTAGNDNTPTWTEDQFAGLHGANIADLSLATNNQYYTWNDVIDFADGYNHNSDYTVDAANGEFRYNYQFSHFGLVNNGGGNNTNNASLIFAGYMVFDQAGTYAMSVNSDDGFKVTVPFANPQSQSGTVLGWYSGGRGNSGTAMPPTGGSRTHFIFRIPTPGAYPIRCLYENGGGGINVEWTLYRYLPDGSVARTIVGDTNYPGVQVYQDSTQSGPFVAYINPNVNYNLIGDGLQTMTLSRGQDLAITLKDGNSPLDTSSLALTFAGQTQPLSFAQASGVTTVTRYGTNALPSGFYGPAVFTYKDMAGHTYSINWTVVSRDYYGTVLNGYPLGTGDESKRGFFLRTFQADQPGGVGLPTRIQVAEQLLAGIWTNNNVANLAGTVNGYFQLAGTGPTTGLINFNYQAPGTGAGDFQVGQGYQDMQFPGMPTLGGTNQNNGFNSFAFEALTYVEFPTNGTYVMGVNSDDGFLVSRGWAAPQNKGALIVNSPTSVAGTLRATLPSMASRLLTNAISGQLVEALGVGNGSTNPKEGCGDLLNPSEVAGKIALVYRGTCGFVNKVQNAAAAGAIAVIIVQDRPVATPADGWFPIEMGITPIQSIPAIMIARADGDALASAISNNVVNVTLTPQDYLVNTPATSPVLGEADFGKGSSDVLFNVTVPEAGVYPLRLMWFQGGGGANAEWFSMVGGNRVLLNDATSTNGPALKAYMGLTVAPTLTTTISGNSMTFNFNGTLQTTSDLNGPWTDVYAQSPVTVPISTTGNKFYRAK